MAQLRAALARAVIAVDTEGANARHRRGRKERRVGVGQEQDGMATVWASLAAHDAQQVFGTLTGLARSLGADDPRGMDARRADLLVGLMTGEISIAFPTPVGPTPVGPEPENPAVTDDGCRRKGGRTSAGDSDAARSEATADIATSLSQGGGSGGDRAVGLHLFLHPLPPPGPVAVVCAWPGRGIPETRTEFTGAAEVVSGVVQLWPPQPPDTHEPESPEPPDVPDGGWFARVLDR